MCSVVFCKCAEFCDRLHAFLYKCFYLSYSNNMLIYQVFFKIIDLKCIKMLIAKIAELQNFMCKLHNAEKDAKKITR